MNGASAAGGPARWGKPLASFDRFWLKVEERLCMGILLAEILVLVWWIGLKGLATPNVPGGPSGGLFLRAIVGAVVLGVVAHRVLRKVA
jgi:hypothetical protein